MPTQAEALTAVVASLEIAAVAAGMTAGQVWLARTALQPRPGVAHMSVDVLDDRVVGYHTQTVTTEDGDVLTDRHELRLMVQGYGLATRDALTSWRRQIRTPANPPTGQALRDAGLGVGQVGTLRDLTAVLQSGWEPRYALDLSVFYSDSETIESGSAATGIVVSLVAEGAVEADDPDVIIIPDPE